MIFLLLQIKKLSNLRIPHDNNSTCELTSCFPSERRRLCSCRATPFASWAYPRSCASWGIMLQQGCPSSCSRSLQSCWARSKAALLCGRQIADNWMEQLAAPASEDHSRHLPSQAAGRRARCVWWLFPGVELEKRKQKIVISHCSLRWEDGDSFWPAVL